MMQKASPKITIEDILRDTTEDNIQSIKIAMGQIRVIRGDGYKLTVTSDGIGKIEKIYPP